MLIDIRTLETANAENKVSFEIGKLDDYKSSFLKLITNVTDEIVLTGPGPVWLYAVLWHEAHGRASKLFFDAPGVGKVEIISAGVATGDGSTVVDGQVVVDVTTLEEPPAPGQRLNFAIEKIAEYQGKALGMIPAFKPGRPFPEFEVVLTGPGPVWLFLALAAALHSRGGKVIYAAPNAPRVVIINHK